jgi:hypothetical protein
MVSQRISGIQRPLSINKSQICPSTLVVHMVSQRISGIQRPLSFNKLQICPSTLVVHMVSQRISGIQCHFDLTNYKFVLQP